MLKKGVFYYWLFSVVLVATLSVFVALEIKKHTKKTVEYYTVEFVAVYVDVTPSKEKREFIDGSEAKEEFYSMLYEAVGRTVYKSVETWGVQTVKKDGFAVCPNNFESPEGGNSYDLFKGFYTDISCATRYDFDKPIVKNAVIYARFEFNLYE